MPVRCDFATSMRHRLFDRVAPCFVDGRDLKCTVRSVPTLVGQRIAAISLGYEDVDDHDTLAMIRCSRFCLTG